MTDQNTTESGEFPNVDLVAVSRDEQDAIIARAKRRQELSEMPPISDALPFVFPVTGYSVKGLNAECSVCRCEIQPNLFRGRVQLAFPTVAHMEAIGLCMQCRVLSCFEYRIHDDGAISGLKDGKWQRWENIGGQSSTRPENQAPRAGIGRLGNFGHLVASTLLWPFYLAYRWVSWLYFRIFAPK